MNSNWKSGEFGYVLALGTLEKAIIIVKKRFTNKTLYWHISMRSHLPFTDQQYEKQFDLPEQCANYAQSIVLEWLNSLSNKQETITSPELTNG